VTARPPRIYVIGPFRAPTEYQRRKNIAMAEAVALGVAESGAHFFCPHMHTAHFDGLLTDEYWLGLGIAWLAECDAAVLVPGWQDYLDPSSQRASRGSIAEVAECGRLGMEVIMGTEFVPGFVAEWTPEREAAMRSLVTSGPMQPLPCDPDPAPERRCDDLVPGGPSGTCESDGHYRCRECARMVRAKLEDANAGRPPRPRPRPRPDLAQQAHGQAADRVDDDQGPWRRMARRGALDRRWPEPRAELGVHAAAGLAGQLRAGEGGA